MSEELKNKIEAILFASGKGLTEDKIAEYCEEKNKKVTKAIKELAEEYQTRDSSLIISKHNDKWKLTVRGKYTKYIEKIVSEVELPRTTLKTLALIAYKSPVLQSDIVNMRGQNAYEHIKELVKEKLITKEESGRSYLLKITDKFYNYFDIEGDEEIKELFENLRKKKEELIELEIINAAKEENKKEEQSKLGNLEIVEITNQEPRRKEKSEEEKKEENKFLNNIDKKIEELSQRIKEEPKKTEEKTNEEEKEKPIDETKKEETEEINYL